MDRAATTTAGRLAAHFPHERGPAEPVRAVAVGLGSVDCRPAAGLLAALTPGTVVVVEDVDLGFAAVAGSDGVRMATRSPHVAALLGGAGDRTLPPGGWHRFVADPAAR